MPFLELQGITKTFGRNEVVRGLSLGVERGEFVSFLGGSGCGKTTTLRMIAGFETPSEGRILLGGIDLTQLPPNKRNLGMVFQNYALFPNMTVGGNIAFGLKVAGEGRETSEGRVDEMLELIHMRDFRGRYPHELSGGQQQRVALARALARQPAALLLDEPLSALDAKIRLSLREDIRAIQKDLGITMIYVTHDQEEALSISDRVAVMREGRIEQIGTPSEIYDRPATPFVASFIGTLNALDCLVIDQAEGLLRHGETDFRVGGPIAEETGRRISLCLRPESLSMGRASAEDTVLIGTIDGLKFLGSVRRFRVRVGDALLYVDEFNDPRSSPPPLGARVELSFHRAAAIFLPATGE